ncbi:hypothetical protein A2U01_0059791, partial [Trifolium medium]|nr:hypothetical protein [Trifolium medium]
MVGMGMHLEEGVREGRLSKGNAPAGSSKRYGSNFPRKKESEVSMVTHGRPPSGYLVYSHVAAVSPNPQKPHYPPQTPQRPPSHYPPLYQPSYLQQPQIRPPAPQQPFN